MKNKAKLLVFDIDGTITDENTGIYYPLIKFLKTYPHPVILASNRGVEAICLLLKDLGLRHNGYGLAENGGVFIEGWNFEAIYDNNSFIKEVVAEMLENNIKIKLLSEHIHRITDVLIVKEDSDYCSIKEYLDTHYGQILTLTNSSTSKCYNINYKNVSKGEGIKYILDKISWQGDVACFGNDDNDLDMVKVGKLYCPHNATQNCKNVATVVSKYAAGRGVYDIIKYLNIDE